MKHKTFAAEVAEMSLVECPECARSISDKAESCPQCGYPMIKPEKSKPYRPMTWVSEEDGYILAKCPRCAKVSKIRKSLAQRINTGYKFGGEGSCSCGLLFNEVYKDPDEDRVKCPSCGSFQVSAGNKGFGLGKAAAGGILLGPVGLLGGILGSKKTIIACLQCGFKWSP